MIRRPIPRFLSLALTAAALFVGGWAQAASVRLVGFDELVESSALVFHGVVVAADSRWISDRQGIVTDVEFRIVETYKGGAAGQRLVLSFAGGVVDGRGMEVSGLRQPVVGEEGVYFVEQLAHAQVNPLFGWDQGHYLVRELPDGSSRVFSSLGLPVVSAAPAASPADVRLSEGLPLGVKADAEAPASAALPLSRFAATIREVALAQQETTR